MLSVLRQLQNDTVEMLAATLGVVPEQKEEGAFGGMDEGEGEEKPKIEEIEESLEEKNGGRGGEGLGAEMEVHNKGRTEEVEEEDQLVEQVEDDETAAKVSAESNATSEEQVGDEDGAEESSQDEDEEILDL